MIVSRFDFDGDSFISPDEVFILLSYIPFKHHWETSATCASAFDKAPMTPNSRQRSVDSLHSEGLLSR